MIGDAPASHLEPRWKFSDLLATYEIPGATAFLWGDTYLQFWNRDKRKKPDGVISAGTCFAMQSEDTQGGTGAIAWYTRDGLEAEGLEAVGGPCSGNIDQPLGGKQWLASKQTNALSAPSLRMEAP